MYCLKGLGVKARRFADKVRSRHSISSMILDLLSPRVHVPNTHRPPSSSFLWFIFRILQGNPKKELPRGLRVVDTLAPKYPKRAYFKAKVSTIWVHGALGFVLTHDVVAY